MPRCGVPVRVQRTESCGQYAPFTLAPLNAALTAQRAVPTKRKIFPLWLLCLALLSQGAYAQAPGAARTTPKWLHDGVVYELFPRDFSAQGDFNGVTARLDQLSDLGVNVLWLMPIHPIGVDKRKGSYGSPYSASDYYAINPDYGTKEDLKRLVSQAHKRGMKVIIDVVLLHTAWDSVLMAHPDFYKHDASGKIVPPLPEWSDVAGLNYKNQELRQYLVTMLEYWVKEFDLDGFRCDTASMVPTSFWEEARAALSKIKPDIMMLAEADKPELLTNAFDIDYEWPLMNTLRKVLEKSAPASEIEQTWQNELKRYPQGALHLDMSDNHDQARSVARFGLPGALAASALIFTLDGVPLIYNGMEVGDGTPSGGGALFEKVPIVWEPKGRPQIRDIYQSLIHLRKQYPAFRTDNVQWIHNSDENQLITFLRSDGKDEFLVAINLSNRPAQGTMDLKNEDDFAPVEISGVQNSTNSQAADLHLDGFEWRIFHRTAKMAAK
ncbi:MAG TPA: alpha-amylase family glycosyl hydrolase [Verrucomicrobiae bacterium]|nr:alpha-amylase family glycosyl hydrolase [Verrucomicrobiae bacterium]